ncbi:MAG: ATP-binding cassette domain-containing protein [Candidatus Desulfofervidaceae bacterium]|nr:ATP-binding cassette domain-containing protein [Candidatus Desulfofervidaceae bacterium]
MLSASLFKKYPAFDLDVSFEIPKQSYNVILGPSGAGKSLTLKLIAGFEKADRASIILENREISSLPPEKRHVVYLPQNLGIFPHLTVYENIIYSFKARYVSIDEAYVRVIIEELGLTPLVSRFPSHLSGGELQRVALARALAAKPKLLLLDEPLSSLDFHLKMYLVNFLTKLKQTFHLTVVHVSHDPIEAIKLAENLFILEKGKIKFQGNLEDFFKDPPSGFGKDVMKRLRSIKAVLDRNVW